MRMGGGGRSVGQTGARKSGGKHEFVINRGAAAPFRSASAIQVGGGTAADAVIARTVETVSHAFLHVCVATGSEGWRGFWSDPDGFGFHFWKDRRAVSRLIIPERNGRGEAMSIARIGRSECLAVFLV